MAGRPKFSQGDKVFAKVRGYPAWPARVEGLADETPNKMKYHVYFYGTGETAVVKNEDICSYVENKCKLGKPKKHKNFTEAVLQIEQELSPEQKQRLKELDTSANISLNDSSTEDTSRKSLNKSKMSISPPPSVESKPKEAKKRKFDGSISEEPEKRKSLPSPVIDPEVLSRSGRKIKPKRFSDFENESEEEDGQNATKPISKNAPIISDLDSEKSAVGDESKHIVAWINNEKVKIPLDVEKPSNLEPDQENAWKMKVHYYAQQLKRRLENGETLTTSVEEHMHQWGRELSRKTLIMHSKTQNDPKTEHLVIEGVLIELDMGIRSALNIKNADTAKCIEILNQLMELKITPLMLKKHPDVVFTIKKVRKYIGNVPTNCTEETEAKFHKDTEIIRLKAETIYHKFQSLFHFPSNKSFWECFENEKDAFYKKTKDLTTDEIIDLVEDLP